MTSIPAEIWLHVAQFIPFWDLRDMLGVNRTFFQLAMSVRYSDAMFTSFDNGDTLSYLRRLRDPAVAQHVRRLRVFADFSDTFNDEYRARYYRRQSEYLDIPEGSWNLRTALDTLDNSFHEVIQTMTEAVTCMTNITSFLIYWRHISPSVEHLHPFLTAAWKAIGPSVEKLELVASLNYMPALVSTTMTGTFMELRRLKVGCFPRQALENQDEPRSTSMATILAPFINKVAPTLHRLSLRTETPELELSSLFNQLGYIPNLERLHVNVWQCETYVLENPLYLSRFLQGHAATLRSFRWGGSLPSDEFRSKDGRSKEELMVDWLSGNRLDEAFSNLLTLELPAPASYVGFCLLIQYIKRSASTLICLRLWGCFLTFGKVDMLVSSFDQARPRGHLRELMICVEVLSSDLVLLLARTCPRLEKLSIVVSYVAETAENGQGAPDTPEEELSNAQKFALRLRGCDFRDWSLNDIDIAQRPDRNDKLYARLMLLFGECIPSVQNFRGSNQKPWCVSDVPDDELRL